MTLAFTNPWEWVADAWADPEDEPAADAFAVLCYEPNCLPRIKAAAAAGFERPQDAERAGVVLPAPCGRCPQEQFHSATEDDVLYGGQAGGGKTKALLMDGLRACVRYPGIWTGAYRRTYDELEESLLKELQKLEYAKALGATWNRTQHELTFPPRRGRVSKLRFRYAESIDDAVRRQGGDYQLLLIDERTLMPPGVVPVLQERLRSADPDIPVLGTRSSANPGGPGHGQVKADFIDATDKGAKVVTTTAGTTRRFIRARLSDNPYLDRDAGYHRTLDAIPDPARRKAMKDGDWSVFAGQFFAAWSDDRHVVEPFPLPVEWDREEGIDYGFAAPWAVVFAAFDNDGRAWVWNELYDTGVGQTDQAKRILAVEGDLAPRARHADPSMWAKTGEANSNAGIYADEGCTLRKGVNDRVNGWARVQHYLEEMPACDLHRALGWETCPRLHVFSNCTNLIRTLPAAPRDKHKPEDIDTTCDDHCLIPGSMVSTDHGDVPIENVHEGDMVLTRVGYCRVLAAGMTNADIDVVGLVLSNGETLIGTAGHPVWVENRGFVSLDAVRYGDMLLSCPSSIESPSTASCSDGIQTPRTPASVGTSRLESATGSKAFSGFTRRSGRRRTVRSLTAATSTTGTATRSTTTPATSSVSLRTSTWLSTLLNTRASGPSGSRRAIPRRWPRLRRGTAPKRAVLGIASTAGARGRSESLSNTPASSAERSTTRSLVTALSGSAPTTASRHGARLPALTTSSAPAQGAARCSSSTATPRPGAAPVRALGWFDAGRSPVYNLTVEDQPEFFANGVLVHNCIDALRYLLMGRGKPFEPAPPTEEPKDNTWDLGESADDFGGWAGGYDDFGSGGFER